MNCLTYWPTAEEFNYSSNMPWQHWRPSDNMFKVWQNLAPSGGRPLGGTNEVLLTKFINRRSSISPIVIFFVANTTKWCWEYHTLSVMRFEYDTLSECWRTSLWQWQQGGRRAQTTINLGSGEHAMVLEGRQQRNACTGALVKQEGGGGHAAVLVGWQWDVSTSQNQKRVVLN